MDKSTVGKIIAPKGQAYCNQPGTSCYYDKNDRCVNCFRPKGWRVRGVTDKILRRPYDR